MSIYIYTRTYMMKGDTPLPCLLRDLPPSRQACHFVKGGATRSRLLIGGSLVLQLSCKRGEGSLVHQLSCKRRLLVLDGSRLLRGVACPSIIVLDESPPALPTILLQLSWTNDPPHPANGGICEAQSMKPICFATRLPRGTQEFRK